MEKKMEKKPVVKKAPKAVDTAELKKPRAPRKKADEVVDATAPVTVAQSATTTAKAYASAGRYIFATGRRKTAVATVMLFEGKDKGMVNKKPFATYFFNSSLQNIVTRPLELTGLAGTYYVVATINGGGMNSQAEAMAHGIAKALVTLGDDVKKILKKNGLLTRDDRKKERKKPGLRRARRAPQWAKR